MAKLLSQNEVSLCYVFKVFLKRSSKQTWLLAIKIDLFKCCSQSQRGDIKWEFVDADVATTTIFNTVLI